MYDPSPPIASPCLTLMWCMTLANAWSRSLAIVGSSESVSNMIMNISLILTLIETTCDANCRRWDRRSLYIQRLVLNQWPNGDTFHRCLQTKSFHWLTSLAEITNHSPVSMISCHFAASKENRPNKSMTSSFLIKIKHDHQRLAAQFMVATKNRPLTELVRLRKYRS